MTQNASDVAAYPAKAATRDKVDFFGQWAIGATGAVGASSVDDPRVTLVRTGSAGTYDLTYPAGGFAFITFELLGPDATPTAMSFILTAKSPTAGTATFIAGNSTAAVEIENGSTLTVKIEVTSRGGLGA